MQWPRKCNLARAPVDHGARPPCWSAIHRCPGSLALHSVLIPAHYPQKYRRPGPPKPRISPPEPPFSTCRQMQFKPARLCFAHHCRSRRGARAIRLFAQPHLSPNRPLGQTSRLRVVEHLLSRPAATSHAARWLLPLPFIRGGASAGQSAAAWPRVPRSARPGPASSEWPCPRRKLRRSSGTNSPWRGK